jgi:dTDP-4-amino-4,6-dideoxygalactose transaminase
MAMRGACRPGEIGTFVNEHSSQATATDAAPRQTVPLLDLKRQYATIRSEVREAIDRVCESQSLILGDEVAALEREISAFLGVTDTVACASGTDALWLAMAAAGVRPGDLVLTTPFTFFASASSIVRCGARPVFADIDPETFNLDSRSARLAIERLRPAAVKAIMPVHLFGECANMDVFEQVAQDYKLSIIEDAAQAFGASWRKRKAGAWGEAAAFSFYPTKNLNAFGDAGCVTTSDPELAGRVRRLRNHGSSRRYHHQEMGGNSRMDAIQGAVLRIKLRHLEDWNARRREIAARYDQLFSAAALAGSPGRPVRPQIVYPQAQHIYHQYVVRVPKRDELRAFLAARGIASEIYYPLPLHLQEAFAYLGYAPGSMPEAERACREVLALPIFPELRSDEQRRVVDAIAEFFS